MPSRPVKSRTLGRDLFSADSELLLYVGCGAKFLTTGNGANDCVLYCCQLKRFGEIRERSHLKQFSFCLSVRVSRNNYHRGWDAFPECVLESHGHSNRALKCLLRLRRSSRLPDTSTLVPLYQLYDTHKSLREARRGSRGCCVVIND